MARLRDAKGRTDGKSGYSRVLGDEELGNLISRVQGTVISAGTELERMIRDIVPPIEDVDTFLDREIMPPGIYLVPKQAIKKSKRLSFQGSEPDFLVFKRADRRQHFHVIELKDGDTFDTKKASAERRSVHSFIEKNAHLIPYVISAHFVCFNQNSRKAIYAGFKTRIDITECMTGQEFCDLIEIDYGQIVAKRREHAADNLDYFLTELTRLEVYKAFIASRG